MRDQLKATMKTYYSAILLLVCIAWTCAADKPTAATVSGENVESTESVTNLPELRQADSDIEKPNITEQNTAKEPESTSEIELSLRPTKKPKSPAKRPVTDSHKHVAHPHMNPLSASILPALWPYYPAPGQLTSPIPYPAPWPYTQPMYYPMQPLYSPCMIPSHIYDQMQSMETMSSPGKLELADSTDEVHNADLLRTTNFWTTLLGAQPEQGTKIGNLIKAKFNATTTKKN